MESTIPSLLFLRVTTGCRMTFIQTILVVVLLTSVLIIGHGFVLRTTCPISIQPLFAQPMIELSGAVNKKIPAIVGEKLLKVVNAATNNVIQAKCKRGECKQCYVTMSGKKVLSCLTKVPAFEGVLPVVIPPQAPPLK